jgi:excisionase family DNA binding protein
MDVDTVAERVGASRETVLGWLRRGKLRGYRLGASLLGWRISEADVQQFLEQSANRPTTSVER